MTRPRGALLSVEEQLLEIESAKLEATMVLARIREKLDAKLAERRERASMPMARPPRYDEVWAEGMAALEAVAADTFTGGGDFEASTLASSEHHLRAREISALNARELPQLWKEVEFRRWENEQLRRQLAIVVLALWSACALRVEAGRVG